MTQIKVLIPYIFQNILTMSVQNHNRVKYEKKYLRLAKKRRQNKFYKATILNFNFLEPIKCVL